LKIRHQAKVAAAAAAKEATGAKVATLAAATGGGLASLVSSVSTFNGACIPGKRGNRIKQSLCQAAGGVRRTFLRLPRSVLRAIELEQMPGAGEKILRTPAA